MEAFPEAESAGRRTLVLGGKVLVLDVEFALRPRADVVGVRTSYAVPNGVAGGNAAGSASLDGFLVDALKAWVTEVQRSDREDAAGELEINGGSGVTTARFGREVSESLRYLMRLDRFASREGDSGIRWFNDIDTLGGTLERLAQAEARAIAMCALFLFFTLPTDGLPARCPSLKHPSTSSSCAPMHCRFRT